MMVLSNLNRIIAYVMVFAMMGPYCIECNSPYAQDQAEPLKEPAKTDSGKLMKGQSKVPVSFSDGHEIGKNDYGRPVVLIAAALGVKPDVFREAFSGVNPAKGGRPSNSEVQKNKQALLKVLSPHGVTNERLDQVSDYYRFQPQRGELWTNSPAKAFAIVENGQIKQIVVTESGSGYSSLPKLTVDGFPKVELQAELHLDKDLKKNGSITAIEIVPNK